MTATLSNLRLPLPMEQIAGFCRRWNIARLEVFGSALREDFRPDSDLDLVATYAPKARWSLLDRVRMKFELEDMLGAVRKLRDYAQDTSRETLPTQPMRLDAVLYEIVEQGSVQAIDNHRTPLKPSANLDHGLACRCGT